jgi:hypothetical protein
VVGIFVLGRDGASEPLFRAILQPGAGVVVNDRVGGVFHLDTDGDARGGGEPRNPPQRGARDAVACAAACA